MDIIQLIETLGIPVAVACVLGYAALFLMKFITGQLMLQLNQQFERFPKVQVPLIKPCPILIAAAESLTGS